MVKEFEVLNEFKAEIQSDKLTVVDFYADWCGPCVAIAPKYIELASKHTDVHFLKVNVDKGEAIAEEFAIEAMPTFLFFKNGKQVDKIVGADIKSIENKVLSLK